MASRAWSDAELHVLEQHVHDDNWLDAVAERIPDRSLLAIEVRMSRVRSVAGIRGKRGCREEDQDQANAKAVIATHRLLEATLRVGRWS
jgi:hypothetical protein